MFSITAPRYFLYAEPTDMRMSSGDLFFFLNRSRNRVKMLRWEPGGIAELPSLSVPKGNAGASMIAHILVSKFVDHLPYYRQSKIFRRQRLHIPDSTIGGWANGAIRNWLIPVYESMKNKMFKTDYLMADETPIPVLSEDKPGATRQGYHWVYYDPVNKLVCFDYRQGRGRAKELSEGFYRLFAK